MTPRSVAPQTSRVELTALLEADLAEVAGFIAEQSGRTKEIVESHLRWFLLENPVRQTQHPLGFGVRDRGRLVGCILCNPQLFQFEKKIIALMGSSSFYVEEAYRGYGGRVFLQYSRLANRWPLFGTSANAQAASLWKAAGANPIPFSEGELFGVLHWPPVAEEFAHRKNVSELVTRFAGSAISNLASVFHPLKIEIDSSNELQVLSSAKEVKDLGLPDSSAKLTALRDTAYMDWRYFSGQDASAKVFVFRSRSPRQIMVTVNQRPRGYRAQINTLNVLDVYPEALPQEWLRIVGALIARYQGSIDAVVLRSQSPERHKMLCEGGFQPRQFDAPTGWFLDKGALLPSHDWYCVPADGDGLI